MTKNGGDEQQAKKRGRPPSKRKKLPDALPGLKGKGRWTEQAASVVESVLSQENLSQKQKAALLGCTDRHIRTLQAKRRAGELTFETPERKPPQPSAEEVEHRRQVDNIIADLIVESPERSAQDIASELFELTGIVKHRSTVRRRLGHLGYTAATKVSSTALYIPKVRLAFARTTAKMLRDDPNVIIIFTDESWMGAQSMKRTCWINKSKGERPLPKNKERWAPKVHTWGALYDGGAYVCDLPLKGKGARGGLTSEDFLDFFVPVMTKVIADVKKRHPGKRIVLMQDGAGVHNRAKEWLESQGIEQLQGWPAHSPDLNPIENAWAYIKRKIGKKISLYKNTHANRVLISKMRDEVVRKTPSELMTSLVQSFPRRLARVIELEGGYTHY